MTLCISLVGAYENVMQKVFEPISQYECASCESKKLTIDSNNSDENGIVHKLYLKCEECVAITEVLFLKITMITIHIRKTDKFN
ncbi:hypothetical protein AAX20_01025 [Oenococcus oeni]|nr:hypothetical protein AAX20_01025 [Oenococcus oeni]